MRVQITSLTLCALFAVLGGCGGDKTTETKPTGQQEVSPGAKGQGEVTPGAKDQEEASSGGEEFWFVTKDDIAAISVRPSRILRSPLLKDLPRDTVFGEMTEDTGIDPMDLEQMTILVAASMIPDPNAPPSGPESPVVVFRFSKAIDAKSMSDRLLDDTVERSHNGRTYYATTIPDDVPAEYRSMMRIVAGCELEERTLFVGPESRLKAILSQQAGSASPLRRMLAGLGTDDDAIAVVRLESVKDKLQRLADEGREALPPPMADLADIPDQLSSAVIRVSISSDNLFSATLTGYDAQSAGKLESHISGGIDMAKQAFDGLRGQLGMVLPGEAGTEAVGLVDQFIAGITVKKSGSTVEVNVKKPAGLTDFANDIGPKLVEMAEQSAQDAMQMNNLKQLALAMHNYCDVNGHLPSTIRDSDGKPLLSWRVHLLPYLEADDLYQQFKLDEPWDSANNKPLIERMPEVFGTNGDGKTRYLAFSGENTPLGGNKAIGFADVIDGTALTIMCVQAAPEKAVTWSKPEDLEFNQENPLAALGAIPDKGFRTALLDGSCCTIPKDIDLETLRRLIQHNDGQPVDDSFRW